MKIDKKRRALTERILKAEKGLKYFQEQLLDAVEAGADRDHLQLMVADLELYHLAVESAYERMRLFDRCSRQGAKGGRKPDPKFAKMLDELAKAPHRKRNARAKELCENMKANYDPSTLLREYHRRHKVK